LKVGDVLTLEVVRLGGTEQRLASEGGLKSVSAREERAKDGGLERKRLREEEGVAWKGPRGEHVDMWKCSHHKEGPFAVLFDHI
jgi:hypothetical protein